ncbi:MAG: alpha/beta fold hydrolase [Rhodococcus sp. (in: high G+C Gram-positive bacteria)]|uniref:alpha/beta hydrolase n=1 Tax=Rhodococcus sp. TaxID=1831 RepID=UPI002AD74E62|nr:alpha/beta fold hydrolase [Rhodococcus sp. (in: high G+C Gram-positive bacteria)]
MKNDTDKLRRLASASPGLRSLRRPATADSPEFDLAYTRTGPPSTLPVVVLPGGPGLASVLPYRRFRARAAKRGVDTIMIEHRGIGLSRSDIRGQHLPRRAVTIAAVLDDIAAVLEHEKIEAAVIYGSSYGTYLACGLGIEHPDLVAGMVLDSTVLSAHDHHEVRTHARSLLWDGKHPDTESSARMLRALVADGSFALDQACDVARLTYEFGGPGLLHRFLNQSAAGRARRTWSFISNLGRSEIGDETAAPFWMEFGPVGGIAFTELNYAPEPDGGPFDPAPQFTSVADEYPPFSGEPFDVPAHLPSFAWPTVLIAGSRDMRTPRPVAELAHSLIPSSTFLDVDNGHSALDTHQLIALHVIERMTQNRFDLLATPSDMEMIRRLPIRGSFTRFLPHIISIRLRFDKAAAVVAQLIHFRSAGHRATP